MHPLKRLLFLCLPLFYFFPAQATHIVGGEMNYTCLGNNQYEIELVVFRDCYNGSPNAWFDNPASIGIFHGASNQLINQLLIPWNPVLNDTLDPVLSSNCFVAPPDVCVHTTTYTATVTLPPIKAGYTLAYQRCCRNQTISNIVNPLATGATFSVFISGEALAECNSNPKFQEWPPLYICVNEPLNFDQSAIDVDGDSIVYKLCTPLEGADQFSPMPQPPNPPPYDPITWISPPYSVNNMLNATPGAPLVINSETGLLSGTPNTIGQFVVGICVDEYRDGMLISTTRRDFQYNVGECGEITSSFFAPALQCGDLTVNFDNASQNASSYLWFFNDPNNPGATSSAFEPSYTYTEPGIYTVTLIAEPGTVCPDTFSQQISVQYSSLFADFTYEFLDCSDSVTVQLIDLTSDSISTPVEWFWQLSTGQMFTEQNPQFTIAAGDMVFIDLLVTAANGCTATASMLLVGPQPLSLEVSGAGPVCFGGSDGSATAAAIGGIPPYEYLWSNTQTTATATGLGAGIHFVTLTDALGCTAIGSLTLGSPDSLAFTLSAQDVTCFGAADGQAAVIVSGGTPPYFYLWSDSQTGSVATGLEAGLYSVTVTDSVGCVAIDSIVVGSPNALALTLASEDESCFGASDGEASVTVSGGTPPYDILWSNNADTEVVTGLSPGLYGVTVTDANQCEAVDTVAVSGPDALALTVITLLSPCEGASTGTIEVEAAGGTPPYQFDWDGGLTGNLLTDLPGGSYVVTLTDANACTLVETILLVSFENPTIEIAEVVPACFQGNTGSITVLGVGGEAPYTFTWSIAGQDSDTVDGLAAGFYQVSIVDANGCANNLEIEVPEEDPVPCQATVVQPVSLFDGTDGIVTVEDPVGGTAPFSYLWSNDSTSATVGNLPAGTYLVTVTDANECQYPCEVTLENPSKIGDFVWDDLDEDGQQDPAEPGFPGVTVELTGTTADGAAVLLTTTTDADGGYLFDGLLPGEYQLIFSDIPIEYGFTQSNTGSDATDSDAGSDGKTAPFAIGYNECRLDLDAGILQVCFNVTYPGEIAGDEVLCGPGNDPGPILEVAPPSGGIGTLEYVWMFRVEGGPWTPIPNSNTPSYDPGPIFETTYFVRCVRRENCVQFVEPDPVVKVVDDEAVAIVSGPKTICVGQDVVFSAADSGPGATYSWNFGPHATPSTATGPSVSVRWGQFGVVTIQLTVTHNGCTAYAFYPVFVTNNPIFCGLIGQQNEFSASERSPQAMETAGTDRKDLEVFPNPNEGHLTVSWDQTLGQDSFIEIFDTKGRKLRTVRVAAGSQAIDLELGELPAGLYLLRMWNDRQAWSTTRIVKQ